MPEKPSNLDTGPVASPRQHLGQADPAPQIARPMAELIVSIWRAQRRLEQGGAPERVMLMVQRHLDAAMSRLDELGIELRAYEGQAYDPGMRAVTPTHFEPDGAVAHETVGETTAPAIFLHGKVASKSQATILVPAMTQEDTEASAASPPSVPKPKKATQRRKSAKSPKSRRKT